MEKQETFNITEEHIKLLKRMYIGWDDGEFGAPAVDCKRPYGNSDVIEDMREILLEGEPKITCPHCEEEIYDEKKSNKHYEKLHKEMQTVLQIGVLTGVFKIGKYIKEDRYNYQTWKFVE